MRVRELIRQATIDPLDAELLLAHALGRDRAWLAAHGDAAVPEAAVAAYRRLAERRTAHEPVAYLLERKEFFGRDFRVTPDSLIPRPATEGLVTLALDVLSDTKEHLRETKQYSLSVKVDSGIVAGADIWGDLRGVRTIVDIGTGSGCIAVTLACERPTLRCIGTDVSDAALTIARENAARLGVADRCVFLCGSLLQPVAALTDPFLLVSNPPYVPAGGHLPPDVADWEPHGALFAGPDGTAVLRPLLAAARTHPACRGVVVECREEQWKETRQGLHSNTMKMYNAAP